MRVRRHPYGLTLVEAMLLLVIISIVAVAAGVGLQAVAKVPAKTDDIMAVNNVILSVMEQTKANLQRTWPSGNFNGSSYAFLAMGTSYSPASTVIGNFNSGTGARTGTAYATPLTGSVLTINNKSYQLTLYIDQADPANGTTYKTDFLCVAVQVCPIISGAANTSSPQKMVTYVAQP